MLAVRVDGRVAREVQEGVAGRVESWAAKVAKAADVAAARDVAAMRAREAVVRAREG